MQPQCYVYHSIYPPLRQNTESHCLSTLLKYHTNAARMHLWYILIDGPRETVVYVGQNLGAVQLGIFS